MPSQKFGDLQLGFERRFRGQIQLQSRGGHVGIDLTQSLDGEVPNVGLILREQSRQRCDETVVRYLQARFRKDVQFRVFERLPEDIHQRRHCKSGRCIT